MTMMMMTMMAGVGERVRGVGGGGSNGCVGVSKCGCVGVWVLHVLQTETAVLCYVVRGPLRVHRITEND